jgi:hypothetical protein
MQGTDIAVRAAGARLVEEARQALVKRGNNATGQLSQSIQDEGVGGEINITAFRYGKSLQFGRSPTVNDGNGDLLVRIRAWIAAKGLSINPYAVTNKIHRKGTKRFRDIQSGANPNEDAWISDFATEGAVNKVFTEVIDAFQEDSIRFFQNALK